MLPSEFVFVNSAVTQAGPHEIFCIRGSLAEQSGEFDQIESLSSDFMTNAFDAR